jgi:acyl-ACP thioesterase
MSEIQEFDKKVRQSRDAKAVPHLEQYAPVWIIEETLIPEDSSIRFNVLFRHNLYGWVTRRYKYDGFNNVLYQKGQRLVDEEEALDIIVDKEPYIEAEVSDTPNAYGG